MYDWGDINDPAIQQAFNYITNGSFDDIALTLKGTQNPFVETTGRSFKQGLLILDK